MSTILEYRSPEPPNPGRAVKVRTMARVLAVGATMWGVLCAWFVIFGSWAGVLIFGPGYVITVGYYWRAFGRPSPKWCRAIWGLSLLVQGSWFGCMVTALFSGPPRGDLSSGDLWGIIMVAWWTGATIVSLVALLIDRGHPATAG